MTLDSINDQKRERNTFFNLQIGINCYKRPVKVDINQQNRFAVHLNTFMDTNMLLIEIKYLVKRCSINLNQQNIKQLLS